METPIYLHSGGANHFKNGEAVGGKLYLTEEDLIFKSHNLNLQNHELIIKRNTIKAIESCNTMWLVPNGLRIILANGSKERFVVNGRKKWLKLLNT